MHNAGLRVLGLDWRYLAFDVHPENLREALEGARAMKFIGLNLTVPHKLIAMDLVDELDDSARLWGAVNTVLFEAQESSGKWKPMWQSDGDGATIRARGFNTDAEAISRAIEEDLGIQLKGAAVLLLGAGGAGRTAALKLADSGVKELYLVNRTRSKAEEMAGEIHKRSPGVVVNVDYPGKNVDLVVNATSLGLQAEDALPFDSQRFSLKKAGCAYDMIYRPAETSFLKEAARNGCKITNGLGMLLYQGAKALELWTGQPAPLEVMRTALREHIYGATSQHSN